MEIQLSNYGKIISTDDTSKTILKEIVKLINDTSEPISINASGVVISTKSARLIFGHLYKKLSKIDFNKKIRFKNASPSFMFALNEGILTELESK